MKVSRSGIIAWILLSITVVIHLFSLNSQRVEVQYSTFLFPQISGFLRALTGFIPFSIGDILYGAAVAWIIWKIASLIRNRKRESTFTFKQRTQRKLLRLLNICLFIYILFNVLWGLNYNRKGIAAQLRLDMRKYQKSELREMNCLLIDKINLSRAVLDNQHRQYPDNKYLFTATKAAYSNAAKSYPFLFYGRNSIKSSLWSWLGNYAGFTGYYNPFTGEAQVNTTVPAFLQPYIACHEVAHQLGYAKEMEANFVGYLAAIASKDTLFHYSVYLDLFMYANRNLSRSDSISAILIRKDLSLSVKKDLEEWRKFSRKHINPAEPVIRWMYGKFLEGNEQPNGIQSYDEVTGFMIAYYKKFGRI